MDRSERCYSVLLVSASQKFTQDVLPLLPERSFSPVVKAADVSSARRCLLERSFDLLIINTPLPAISDAIYNAIGTRFYELPITPEQIAMAVAQKE